MLVKQQTLTDSSYLVLAEHTSNKCKQKWDEEICITAQAHHDIFQDFDFNLYLKVFSRSKLK
jgi:hypothetical protein